MPKKLTNNIVDDLLKGRNIKRLSDLINARHAADWLCLIDGCNYQWKTSARSILNNNTGCPNCSGKAKLTNNIVDQRIVGRKIKRLSNITNNINISSWQCLIDNCNFIWKTNASNILNGNKGCPKCAGNIKLTNEDVDKRLFGRNIKRLSDIDGGNNRSVFGWKCLVSDCNYIWKTSISHILNRNSGCPHCSGKAKLTNDIVDQKLIGRNIKRLSDIDGSLNKNTVWQCLVKNCNNIWRGTPNNIVNAEKGCPNCKSGKNEKLVWAVIKDYCIFSERHKNIINISTIETRRIFVDFYITEINTIIEYNGSQHYSPAMFGNITKEESENNFIKQQERDQYLQQFCNTNNINLIWIDGRKYTNKKLKNYLIDEIIPKLKNAIATNAANIYSV